MDRTNWDRDDTSQIYHLRTYQKQQPAIQYADKINTKRSSQGVHLMTVPSGEGGGGWEGRPTIPLLIISMFS